MTLVVQSRQTKNVVFLYKTMAILYRSGFLSIAHLPANEDIEAVAVLGVVGTRHGVERADFQRVLVHHKKVCAVLLSHQVAKLLLVHGGKVIVHVGCFLFPGTTE